MQLAIVAAGFTPGEADQLRRAMAAWKRARRPGALRAAAHRRHARARLRRRVRASASSSRSRASANTASPNRTPRASRCWCTLGLAQVLRARGLHCALLNSQPMGFYAPAQLVRDARDARRRSAGPICVCHSDWDCTLERRARWRTRAAAGLAPGQVAGRGGRASASSRRAPTAPFDSVQDLALARHARAPRPRGAGRRRRAARAVGQPPSHLLAGRGQRARAAAGAGAARGRRHAAARAAHRGAEHRRRLPLAGPHAGAPSAGAAARAAGRGAHRHGGRRCASCRTAAWCAWPASSRRASARRAPVASCSSRSRTRPAT